MDIVIDKAKNSDIDLLEKLYDDLNDYLSSHTNYPGWKKGIYPTRAEAEHFFESGTLYVAKRGEQIVGSMALTHEPEQPPANGSWLIEAEYDDVFVSHVFVVNPLFFRNGIGEAMLNFAEEQGKKEGMKSIRLDVYENNKPAIRAYEKCGYRFIDKVDLGYGEYGLDLFSLYEKLIP